MNRLKIVLLVSMVFLLTTTYGQFEKGRMLVGGTALFSITKDKSRSGNTTTVNGTNVTFGLSPQFGYFVMDNLAVGGVFSFQTSAYSPRVDTDYSYSSTRISIGPFARYYFDPGIFVHVGLGVGSQSSHSELGNNTSKNTYGLTELKLGAGYAFFLTKNVALEPMITYETAATRLADSNPKIRNVEGGIYLRAGLQVYLR
jgi:hypothetical protein